MLDVSDPEHPVQTGIVNLGVDAGPHMIALTDDDKRLVVSDYFLNEDDFGKIHFEGDHHVRVIKVFKNRLALDPPLRRGFQHGVRDRPGAAARGGDEVTRSLTSPSRVRPAARGDASDPDGSIPATS